MKVYSLWVKTINTQKFQIEYFLDLDYTEYICVYTIIESNSNMLF